MWLVWQECNNRIFEDNERSLYLLKHLFGTLFQLAQCISISAVLQSVSFNLSFLYFFMSRVLIVLNMMFFLFNKSIITYKKNTEYGTNLVPTGVLLDI